MGERDEADRVAVEAEDRLLSKYGYLMQAPASSVEGLDGAACDGHATDLARMAMGAADTGVSAEQWRDWIREELGERAEVLVADAEACMRASGLWPWTSSWRPSGQTRR